MLLILDKPSGITSYDCIRALKSVFPKTKIGHAGTLDPLASGLMLIGVGSGTKSLHGLQGLDKSYLADIDLSRVSDTWDIDYREYMKDIKKTKNMQNISFEDIKSHLDLIIPEYNLPLPPFSAKKKNGKKMYELARQGEQEIEYRIMKVYGYSILHYTFSFIKLTLDVGSGTYIRSIAYRLGQQLSCGGIITALRRTSIGKYRLDGFELEKEIFFSKNNNEYIIRYCEIPHYAHT